MVKKRSAREIIESTKNPKLEQAYVKFPGKEIMPVGKNRGEYSVGTRWEKVRGLWKNNERRPYTHLHTHPFPGSANPYLQSLPSYEDVQNFICDDNSKSMVIGQTDAEKGRLNGYFVLRKTKDTPKSDRTEVINPIKKLIRYMEGEYIPSHLESGLRHYCFMSRDELKGEEWIKSIEEGIEDLAKAFKLQYKFIPGKKSNVENSSGSIGLEKLAATASVIAILSGSFFFSTKITANVVGVSAQTSSLIGAGLIIIGLVSGLFYFRSKKK